VSAPCCKNNFSAVSPPCRNGSASASSKRPPTNSKPGGLASWTQQAWIRFSTDPERSVGRTED
jgi:hypothetical protein